MNEAAIIEARQLAEASKGKIPESAKMWHLPEDHFCAVVEWIIAGIPSKKIKALCAKELKLPPVKIPGEMCLSRFWQDFSPFWLVARRRRNQLTLETVDQEIDKSPMKVDAVLRDEIKQRAWELINNPNPPEKLVKAFLNAVLKMRDQDDRVEQRKLEIEKFQASQRTKIEAGMAAFYDAIKEIPAAVAAYRTFEETVKPLLEEKSH
jgi:hypothetical protein